MSSPVHSTEPSDEDEEGKLYGYIYELREEECETDRTQISSSPKQSPVHLEIPAERRTHTAGAPKVCTLKKVQGIKKSVQTKEPLQKKPWNQPNANVSDYFNYGFTEETWKAYYKKQTKLQAFKRSQKLKIMAQKTRDGVKAEKSVSSENSSSGKPSTVASRKSEANGGVRKGLTRCRSRKTSSPCYRAYNAQDICDSSHEKSVFPFYDKPLGASTTIFPSVSPSSFLFQPRSGYGSSFCMSTLSSKAKRPSDEGKKEERQADGSDVPVKPLFQCSSGNSTQLAESIKGWNRHIRERKHDRSREHDLDRESIREKNREKHSSSSSSHRRRSSTTRSQKYSRVKEQKKARSSKDENHRCCSSKDILGENRRKDRSWKPDRVSYSSSQKSCRGKNEDKTVAQDETEERREETRR